VSDPAANVAVAERWHTDLFQAGKLEVADEILAPEVALHAPFVDSQGIDAAKAYVSESRAAYGDIQITHADIVAGEDKVAIRWTGRGIHQGEVMGIPATNKEIHTNGIDIFQLRDGKITEVWVAWNVLDDLLQMGATITPAQ
jgi:steroid delta-isomerase-like uncharacterized protein